MEDLVEDVGRIANAFGDAAMGSSGNREPEDEKDIHFRDVLPGWVCHPDVAALAEDVEGRKLLSDEGDEILVLPFRCCVGPAVLLTKWACILSGLTQVGLFFGAKDFAYCEGKNARYPTLLLAVAFLFIALRIAIEIFVIRYAMIPFVEVTKCLKVLGVRVSFHFWLAWRLAMSFLNLCDITTDSFFHATTIKRIECNPEMQRLWHDVVLESFLGFPVPWFLDLRNWIWASFALQFLQLIYPLIEVQPGCCESHPDYRVGYAEHTRLPSTSQQHLQRTQTHLFSFSWTNLLCESINQGDALYLLAEAAGMSTLTSQTLAYPKKRSLDLLRRDKFVKKNLHRHYSYMFGMIRRAIIRVGLCGIFENSIQTNLQVSLLGLLVASTNDSGPIIQSGMSLGLSIIMSVIRLWDGYDVVACSMKIENIAQDQEAELTASPSTLTEAFSGAPSLNDAKLVRAKHRATAILIICEVICALAFIYAGIKLAAIFLCEDSMWNLRSGCVDLSETHSD